MNQLPVKRNILGVDITDASKADVLEYISETLQKKTSKLSIVTPNPEIVVFAKNHPEFRRILNETDLALCDGTGLLLASHLLGKPLEERIAGIDMMVSLCQMAVDQALGIGLLGARPGVADKTAQCLRENYPTLKINFIASEWDAKEFPKSGVDMLFVAYGFPKQEVWIHDHLKGLPIKLAMGVGGSFDILSGDISRAPFMIRMIGFEWLYRLVREPWRWKRQLALLTFVRLVIKAKLT